MKASSPSASRRPSFGRLLSRLHAPVYECRLERLIELIRPHIASGDRILDVGCGTGQLGYRLQAAASSQKAVVTGLEKFRRGNEPIQVKTYQSSGEFPFPDDSFDMVLVADVLHHEDDETRLLKECIRVSRRNVVIKDHKIDGPFAFPRICLIDWAANAPYGVQCLYRYHTPEAWKALIASLNLEIVQTTSSINLYPPFVNLLFGRRLQYFAVTRVKK